MHQPLSSSICKYSDLSAEWYSRWIDELNLIKSTSGEVPGSFRKYWEWTAILEVLNERGRLRSGIDAIGFAVGTEPLSSLMAAKGVKVLASDLAADEQAQDWTVWNQHAASLEAVFKPEIVSREIFDKLVSFRPINMADLSSLPDEAFDFAWSSCAFEHIGNLEDGLKFVVDAMRLIKPGGMAVHTTEINLSSNEETIFDGHMCIYRKKDIEELERRLRLHRCGIEKIDWDAGCHEHDLNFDIAPYGTTGRPHIKLELGGFITTSIMLVIRKGGSCN
jgi:2-polyprenyl-3-methyl-5-hydroxy-6-metoxy-1,4-benzoquinol methylase